ncbi:MAG: rhamnogalacturonan acetylesterase [Bacteroidota bacterium]
MKKIIAICVAALSLVNTQAQTVFKYSFGNGKIVKGYIPVTPQTTFSYDKGYGFDQGSAVEAIDRGGTNPLIASYITSSKPFYFSVKLPEGNYDVKIILGDIKGSSATTVRTECRRLMLENIQTASGKISIQKITVHVKDSLIRNAMDAVIDKVKLKTREYGFLHWDNLLTLEFNDSLPKVCAIEIVPNKTAATIFLAGNSTVVDQDREPWAAWGQMFPRFIQPGKAVVANYAESGETLKAFKAEKRLEKIWSMAKTGDYLLIEFTHNDQKPGSNYLDPFTTYKQTLKEWITEARKRNITPVLVTSMHRRSFDSTGHIINTLLDYPEAMRQTASEENVSLIDLNAMSKILYEAWGEERSIKAFVHYPANTFPHQPEPLKDNTHFNPYGAYQLASCVVSSIRQQHLPLEKFTRKEIPLFDPAKPSPAENFYWPQSAFVTATKPDGN